MGLFQQPPAQANAFYICCYLDNNTYEKGIVPPDFEVLLALGSEDEILSTDEKLAFQRLKDFYGTKKRLAFGIPYVRFEKQYRKFKI